MIDYAKYWPEFLPRKFGEFVCKKGGAEWHGQICGWYGTELNEIGYAVKSFYERNSVQIYPSVALIDWVPPSKEG